MIPKFKAFIKNAGVVVHVQELNFKYEEIVWEGSKYTEVERFQDIELMQSTGVKDKNNIEIYEGDILKGPMDYGPAGFIENIDSVRYHKIYGFRLNYFLLEYTEVIGNIYENGDLLNG